MIKKCAIFPTKDRQGGHQQIFQLPENEEHQFPAAGRKTEDQKGAKMDRRFTNTVYNYIKMERNCAIMGPRCPQECHRQNFQLPENGERHFPKRS
jgi:hypothetical protein